MTAIGRKAAIPPPARTGGASLREAMHGVYPRWQKALSKSG